MNTPEDPVLSERLYRSYVDGQLSMMKAMLRALVLEHPSKEKLQIIGQMMLGPDKEACPPDCQMDEWVMYRSGRLKAHESIFFESQN